MRRAVGLVLLAPVLGLLFAMFMPWIGIAMALHVLTGKAIAASERLIERLPEAPTY